MSFYHEFKGLKEITLDGEEYVSKRELLELIKGEKKRVMAGTEPGYIQPKEKRRIAAMLALNHLAVLVNKKALEKVHKRIEKRIIFSLGEDCIVYFRGTCMHAIGRDGKETPVFTEDPTEAAFFDDEEAADRVIERIHEEWPEMRLFECCANFPWQLYGLKRMHSECGWPGGRAEQDVLDQEMFWTRELG